MAKLQAIRYIIIRQTGGQTEDREVALLCLPAYVDIIIWDGNIKNFLPKLIYI